jgi:hypothetical protein
MPNDSKSFEKLIYSFGRAGAAHLHAGPCNNGKHVKFKVELYSLDRVLMKLKGQPNNVFIF